MENKANIIDDENGGVLDDDDGDDDEDWGDLNDHDGDDDEDGGDDDHGAKVMAILKNQVNILLYLLENSFQARINNGRNVIIIGRIGGEKCNNLHPVCFFISLLTVVDANFPS